MRYLKHLGLCLLLTPAVALAQNSEMYLKMESRLVSKLLNDATSFMDNEQNLIVRDLDNYQHQVVFDLADFKLDQDLIEYAHSIAKVNLKGKATLDILLEKPQVKGNVYFEQPKFIKKGDGLFDVELEAKIRDYNINFKHIWFTSSGVIELDRLSENSCHELITSSAQEGADFILDAKQSRANVKNYIQNFYANLDQKKFKGHVGKLWARVDNLNIGWPVAGKYYQDNRNQLIIKIKASVDMNKGGEGIKLTSFTHNLNKSKGAWLPVSMPSSNIILPPTFIRTQARKIEGDILTNEEITRCTYVDNKPTRTLISSFSKEISRQLAMQLTDANVNKMVEVANKFLEKVAIPEVPQQLVLSSEDNRTIKDKFEIAGETFYIYQNVKFDFDKDLYGIIKNFTTYRAALGLGDLESSKEGNFLYMGLNSDLVIDGTRLSYREDIHRSSPLIPGDFPWNYDLATDVGLSINGKMLNKIINPIKDHLLATKVPDGLDVYLNDNLFSVDHSGNIDLNPMIQLDVEGIEILRVTFNIKAKPSFYSGQDGKHWLKLKLDVPSAKTIIDSIEPGRVIRRAETIVDIILWPLYPVKEYVIKPKVKEAIRWRLQNYIDNIKSNIKDIEITNFVKTYGVRPSFLKFRKIKNNNFVEVGLQVQEFYNLNKVMQELL